MQAKADYIKLTVKAPRSLHDAEASSRRPRRTIVPNDYYITSWTWNFTTKAEKDAALAAAQTKREVLKKANPDLAQTAFRFSTLNVGSIRGVPGVGFVAAADKDTELKAVAA